MARKKNKKRWLLLIEQAAKAYWAYCEYKRASTITWEVEKPTGPLFELGALAVLIEDIAKLESGNLESAKEAARKLK